MKKIMIVDDSESDQFFTQRVVKRYDSDIDHVTAYDGKEALSILESDNPDIILLDINMPLMNGHEFLEAYNKKGGDKSVIVMLTSSSQELDKEKASQYPFVKDYIVKPLKEEDLKKLEGYLDNK